MKIILFIGLMFVGVAWYQDVGHVWAVTSQHGRGGEQAIVARDFERAIISALIRQYGRPHHRVGVRILFPKTPLIVSAGRLHLFSALRHRDCQNFTEAYNPLRFPDRKRISTLRRFVPRYIWIIGNDN